MRREWTPYREMRMSLKPKWKAITRKVFIRRQHLSL